jgi:hypothetical protein
MIFSDSPEPAFFAVRDHYSHEELEVREQFTVNFECL